MSASIVKNISFRNIANDKIYTPPSIAKKMIDMCDISPTDKVLDPSKGAGVFYDNLPECIKSYCEIEEDIDFFDYKEEVDVIVGNPPYSLWDKWIDKTIELNPEKICYIFGVYNFTHKRLERLHNAGYNIQKLVLAKIDWWFSPSFICLLEKKEQPDFFEVMYKTVQCDDCGRYKCRRRAKNDVDFNINKCRFKE